MAEEAGKDQEEKHPTGEVEPVVEEASAPPPEESTALARTPATWDGVLARAELAHTAEPESSAAPPQRSRRPMMWLKAATPALVVVLYLVYRFGGSIGGSNVPLRPEVRANAASLTGVKATENEPLALSREARILVGELEAIRARENWQELRRRVESETRPELAVHPVVRAFGLLAATRSGELNVTVERGLSDVTLALRPASREYRELLHELEVARAWHIAVRSSSSELLAFNTDLLHQLLGSDVESAFEVKVRLHLATAHEEIADKLRTEADGYLRKDRVKAAEARFHYQAALRWIVETRQWYTLRAISPAAERDVARIVGKLSSANSLYHGIALPLSGRDSGTWSGMAGSPVHDNPPGGRM